MELLEKIKAKAKQSLHHIVLPEGEEPRTLKAASIAVSEGFARITVLGNPEIIAAKAAELEITNLSDITILDPNNNPNKAKYVDLMLEIGRAHV